MPRTSKPSTKGPRKPIDKSIDKVQNGPIFTMHPYDSIIFLTDSYYNGIFSRIVPLLKPMITYLDCNDAIVKRIALCVTAYFEDKVTGLEIWNTFVRGNHELYGRWLPWYGTSEEYDLAKVNLEDLVFLLWMLNVSTEETDFTPPDNSVIRICAKKIYDLLLDEFSVAPANTGLLEIITSEKVTEDFYQLKNVLNWLSYSCYMMATPAWDMELRNKIRQQLQRMSEESDPSMLSYYEYSYESLSMRVGPLALYPKEWLVRIRQQHGVTHNNDEILAIESTPFYPFLVISNNGETITIRSCRGVEYQIQTDSFNGDYGKKIHRGQFLMTSLARYKGNWGINGFCSIFNNQEEGVSDEQRLESMAQSLKRNGVPVDIFGVPVTSILPEVPQKIGIALDKAIAGNKDNRLFYFPSLTAAMKWQEKLVGTEDPLRVSNQEIIKLFGKRPVVTYVTDNHMIYNFPYANTINDPTNPYFQEDDAYRGSIWLYNKFGLPDEFVAYLVKKGYLTNLTFDEEDEQPEYEDLIQENLPFWASFMRQYPC